MLHPFCMNDTKNTESTFSNVWGWRKRFFNEVIYIRDYLEGGLTSKIVKIRRESPKASRIYYRELLQLDIPWKYKMRGLLNLIRYTINVI